MYISKMADNAADYIEKHGHLKWDIGESGGSACLRGAVKWANGGYHFDDEPVCQAVVDYLGLPLGNSGLEYADTNPICRAVSWNNADERTGQEVIDVLRDVATKYRNDEMSA